MTNPILTQVIAAVTAAASASLQAVKLGADEGIEAVKADVPKLTDEGVQLLETVVAPKLDVPPAIVAYFKSENATLEAPVDQFAAAELELLKARLDALIPNTV